MYIAIDIHTDTDIYRYTYIHTGIKDVITISEKEWQVKEKQVDKHIP